MIRRRKLPDEYEKIKSRIEKNVNPYILVKIFMPEGVKKEAFLQLENNREFIESLKDYVKEWLKSKSH